MVVYVASISVIVFPNVTNSSACHLSVHMPKSEEDLPVDHFYQLTVSQLQQSSVWTSNSQVRKWLNFKRLSSVDPHLSTAINYRPRQHQLSTTLNLRDHVKFTGPDADFRILCHLVLSCVPSCAFTFPGLSFSECRGKPAKKVVYEQR